MVYTELIDLIEISDEIFIIWIFYSWLKIVFLILKNYQHNNGHINHIKIINIKHVQLKLLIFKNNLILMSISEVLFIIKTITSIINEGINNTVDCFQLIDDIEIKFWKELISVSLMAIELTDNDEVFQIFIISEHNYRINNVIDFRMLLFKCFNNN